jgi:5'-3' exonuclease
MVVNLIDAGYFVSRATKHWAPCSAKGPRNMRWWNQQYKQGKCTFKKMRYHQRGMLMKDVDLLYVRMRQMASSPEQGHRVIVCYDGTQGRQSRGQLLPTYKAHRGGKAAEDASTFEGKDFRDQFSMFKMDPMCLSKGWEGVYEVTKEADDLIAELTEQYLNTTEDDIIIFSKDQDFYQVLAWDDRVRLHNCVEEVTREDVFAACGVPPEYYVDWKCLVGDTADNIPGFPRMGPSSASKLLIQYGGMDQIPDEDLSMWEVSDWPSFRQTLLSWKTDTQPSATALTRNFGKLWTKLVEEEQEFLLIPSERERILNQVPQCEGLFEPVSYRERLNTYRQIIMLPFHGSD